MTDTEDLIKKRNAILVQRDKLSQQLLIMSGAVLTLDALIKEQDDKATVELDVPADCPPDVVEQAVDWIESEEGQAALKAHGYDPHSDPATWPDKEFSETYDHEEAECSSTEGC